MYSPNAKQIWDLREVSNFHAMENTVIILPKVSSMFLIFPLLSAVILERITLAGMQSIFTIPHELKHKQWSEYANTL